MGEVGTLFEKGRYYVPELLTSARAAEAILELAEPILSKTDYAPRGTVVMGTVKGDLHDIGKNIVSMMLRGNGFKVVDLGTDVNPTEFIEAVEREEPDIVGMSALLTTTMKSMRITVELLEEAGLRDEVGVMVGGAPITESFAEEIRVDGFAPNAASAVRLAKSLMDK
jgi:5-methyltetrahydrofolate--homocysteine methyltransferase